MDHAQSAAGLSRGSDSDEGWLPFIESPITVEQRLEKLEELSRIPHNSNQGVNIAAVRRDYIKTGTAHNFYQNGEHVELDTYDPKAGPLWFEGAS